MIILRYRSKDLKGAHLVGSLPHPFLLKAHDHTISHTRGLLVMRHTLIQLTFGLFASANIAHKAWHECRLEWNSNDASNGCIGRSDDTGVAQRKRHHLLTSWKLRTPIGTCGPCFVGTIVDDSRMLRGRWTCKERPLFVQARFIVLKGISEVKVTMGVSVVKLNRDSVVGFLIHRPHETSQVKAKVSSIDSCPLRVKA